MTHSKTINLTIDPAPNHNHHQSKSLNAHFICNPSLTIFNQISLLRNLPPNLLLLPILHSTHNFRNSHYFQLSFRFLDCKSFTLLIHCLSSLDATSNLYFHFPNNFSCNFNAHNYF